MKLLLGRPIKARGSDATLGFDAYRTVYGVREGVVAVWALLGILAVVVGIWLAIWALAP